MPQNVKLVRVAMKLEVYVRLFFVSLFLMSTRAITAAISQGQIEALGQQRDVFYLNLTFDGKLAST
jgi:hypothetical protein